MWLASASAVIVLLASGVAISRLSDQDDENLATTGPEATAPPTGAPSGSSSSEAGSGPAGASATGTGGDSAAAGGTGTGAAPGTAESAAPTTPPRRTANQRDPSASTAGSTGGTAAGSPASTESGTGGGSQDTTAPSNGSAGGGSGPGGGSADGSQGGGQEPPEPNRSPPERTALLAASVSVGEGAQGGVVGLGVTDTAADADVTIGTTPLVGDHPPSEGTGVQLGGQLFQPSSSIHTPSG